MSFDLKDSFTPPPPPRRGRSPWAVAGIGCAALAVLGFGGCGIFMARLAKIASDEQQKPLDKSALVRALGDIPQVSDAQLDEAETKTQRATIAAMGKLVSKSVPVVAAFRTRSSPAEVLAFYRLKLAEKNFVADESRQNLMTMFRRGNESILLTVTRTSDEPTLYVLQHRID